MYSAGEIRYNILVSKICDKAHLEETRMPGELTEECGKDAPSLITLRATRPGE